MVCCQGEIRWRLRGAAERQASQPIGSNIATATKAVTGVLQCALAPSSQ